MLFAADACISRWDYASARASVLFVRSACSSCCTCCLPGSRGLHAGSATKRVSLMGPPQAHLTCGAEYLETSYPVVSESKHSTDLLDTISVAKLVWAFIQRRGFFVPCCRHISTHLDSGRLSETRRQRSLPEVWCRCAPGVSAPGAGQTH